ncbi:unnamed protein product [Dicrocoelium dendriticum]|nr:unnamed protein product [Dicrocoelium dendriticum]
MWFRLINGVLVLLTLCFPSTWTYIKMDYPDYCFYDAMRFDEDTGFFFYLNPVKNIQYNVSEEALLSTNAMRLDFGYACSVVLHGMRDPMRPWVLCCKVH